MPVYPRWRGEHGNLQESAYRAGGLSPLARGTQICYLIHQRAPRFIPAGAGNTSLLEAGFNKLLVYPRWRGEHASSCADMS